MFCCAAPDACICATFLRPLQKQSLIEYQASQTNVLPLCDCFIYLLIPRLIPCLLTVVQKKITMRSQDLQFRKKLQTQFQIFQIWGPCLGCDKPAPEAAIYRRSQVLEWTHSVDSSMNCFTAFSCIRTWASSLRNREQCHLGLIQKFPSRRTQLNITAVYNLHRTIFYPRINHWLRASGRIYKTNVLFTEQYLPYCDNLLYIHIRGAYGILFYNGTIWWQTNSKPLVCSQLNSSTRVE